MRKSFQNVIDCGLRVLTAAKEIEEISHFSTPASARAEPAAAPGAGDLQDPDCGARFLTFPR